MVEGTDRDRLIRVETKLDGLTEAVHDLKKEITRPRPCPSECVELLADFKSRLVQLEAKVGNYPREAQSRDDRLKQIESSLGTWGRFFYALLLAGTIAAAGGAIKVIETVEMWMRAGVHP